MYKRKTPEMAKGKTPEMAKGKTPAAAAQTDPVLNVLTELARQKTGSSKEKIQAAIIHYNNFIAKDTALVQQQPHQHQQQLQQQQLQRQQQQQQAKEVGKQQKSGEDQYPTPASSQEPGKASEKYKERYEAECMKSERLEVQISELRTRLSKFTGEKMKEGNSNITDLSDPYRPTKLAETFRELYDNEWTNAYDALLSETGIKDDDIIIQILAVITREVGTFCTAVSTQQLERMQTASGKLTEEVLRPNVTESNNFTIFSSDKAELCDDDEACVQRHVKDIRKELAYLSVKGVTQLFEKRKMTDIRDKFKISKSPEALDTFVAKTTSCVWMMKLQDRPVEMLWLPKGQPVDKKKFTFYTNRGDTVAMTIWPALLLHTDGPMLCKGVIQGK